MYSVRLGYNEAVKRIKRLRKNGHHAESLVTSVFTIEKTLRRVLRALVVSAGFPSVQATILMKKFDGLNKMKEVWECFDPDNRKLSDFVAPSTLQAIAETQGKRNDLVHGSRVYGVAECEREAGRALQALDDLRQTFRQEYGYDGWSKLKVRKTSTLHADQRVTKQGAPPSASRRTRRKRAR
jgi:hypothetical protein